jgi:hypothetical protein
LGSPRVRDGSSGHLFLLCLVLFLFALSVGVWAPPLFSPTGFSLVGLERLAGSMIDGDIPSATPSRRVSAFCGSGIIGVRGARQRPPSGSRPALGTVGSCVPRNRETSARTREHFLNHCVVFLENS